MNKRGIWSGIVGAFDPIIKKIAQDLAKKVPKNSPLRSGTFELVQGVVKGLIETFAEKMPSPIAIGIEKITDFSDFFSGALGSIPEKDKKALTEDWMKKFFVDAGFRLKKAKDPQEEFGRIKEEFELRCELIKLIEATQPKPPAPEPPKSWKKIFKEWKKQFREFSQGFEEFTKEVDKVLGINAEAKKINNVLSPIRDTLRVDITEEKRRWFRWN